MYFTEHHFILLLLRILLFIIAFCNGLHLSHSSRPITWHSFFPTIVAYTLYAGLRWGRGVDYNLYYWVYKDINSGVSREDNEPLFELLVKIFGFLGLEWQHFVVFMSFFLIFSGCYFLKENRKELFFVLPLLVLSLDLAENLMRWFLGFSFLLIGLYYLLKNNQRFFFLFAFFGFLVHYGLAVDIIIFYLVWLTVKRKMLKPIIVFVVYLGLLLLFDPQFMGRFADFVQHLDLGTRFLMYQNNAEAWLTGDAHDYIRSEASLANVVKTAFSIFIGYSFCKKSKKESLTCIYNWSLIGWVFYPAAIQIEIAMRINVLFIFIGQIFIAYMYYDILIKRRKQYRPFIRYVVVLFIIYNIYSLMFKYVFSLEESQTLFVWDAAGRAVL